MSVEQVAHDLGIRQTTSNSWLRAADAEEDPKSVAAPDVLRENRDLTRRNRLLEQENEVLRKAAVYLACGLLPGKVLPVVKELAAAGGPDQGTGGGLVSGLGCAAISPRRDRIGCGSAISPSIRVWSNRIVGYAIAERMTS
ncbi:hypothetical protein MB901379_03401 [Mycobacterium basiliense]|uniref:Transposase n=1 Tax=Mycobacterium basiliense TaxID=2094119 RepID=A0A3S4FPG7_9MYCO|nr:hypothetical protein [Mycobacterium basiliense]VDM89817.1 hypothetical protein MB901379_03401 [Mycobacterium basiliense]